MTRDARTTFAVGVDPGVSTGLVILRGDGLKVHARQGSPELTLDDFAVRFSFLRSVGFDVLVGCERYVDLGGPTGRGARTTQPVTQRVVGLVEQLARLNGWPCYLQSPSDVKALVDDALLRAVDLWTTPRDVECRDAHDVNDAMRHALAVLAHHRASLFDRILLTSSA